MFEPLLSTQFKHDHFLALIQVQGRNYSVSPKKVTIQIQVSALIQTTYCSALKFIIAFERRMRKNH